MEAPTIALVGRPNVGKSRLFNALLGKRISIVHDQPGVTRDVVAEELGWGPILLDTGGLGLKPQASEENIVKAAEMQVELAIASASLVLWVVDARDGRLPLDDLIADRLRDCQAPIWLVVNKVDSEEQDDGGADFSAYGIEEIFLVSAEHNRGVKNLKARLAKVFPEDPFQPDPSKVSETTRLCFAGKPNVGKSSIGNALLKEDRFIVNEMPGTTRDSVSHKLIVPREDGSEWVYELVDTAGLRKGFKYRSAVDFFSSNRSEKALAKADVVFLIIDAMEGITRQDKSILARIAHAGKALCVVVNKWDYTSKAFDEGLLEGFTNLHDFRKRFTLAISLGGLPVSRGPGDHDFRYRQGRS